MSETTLEFITLRPPERIRQRAKRLRYIRDLRTDAQAPFRDQLLQADVYGRKVALAQSMVSGPLFFSVDHFYAFRHETVVDTLRTGLHGPFTRRDGSVTEGSNLAELIARLEQHVPALARSGFFHDPNPPGPAVGLLFLQYAAIWNSLYAVTILAGIHRVETNYLIDALRGLHLLAALRTENLRQPAPATWPYFDFDAYEAVLAAGIVRYSRLI